MTHAFLAKALSPPQPEAIDNALETLRLLKALDEEEVCMRFLPLSLKFVCMSPSPRAAACRVSCSNTRV